MENTQQSGVLAGDLPPSLSSPVLLPRDAGFRRVLGPVHLTLLGVGAIVGAGIFVITGTAAAQHAGPAILISFAIAGAGCLFAGLCYAEFASMIPLSGSAYIYAYAAMGRGAAWFIGWNLVLEYLVSAAAVAVGWSGYFGRFLQLAGLSLPRYLAVAPFAFDSARGFVRTGAIMNLPAFGIVLILTVMLMRGMQESARFNAAMVAIKLSIIVLVIALGLPYVRVTHFLPFVPPNTGQFGHFGWSGVLSASAIVFFAYLGFDTVSVAAQEARHPQRDVPIGILSSLAICTVLYMLMAFVLIGLVPYQTLNVPDPVAVAVTATGLRWLVSFVTVGACVGLTSVMFASLYAMSRIFFAMSCDGFLPSSLSRVHRRFRTPYIGTAITGLLAAVLASVMPLGVLSDLVSIGTLCAFAAVCLGVLLVRRHSPHAHRGFRVPYVGFVAPAGILSCGVMMFGLSTGTWFRLAIWTVLGTAIFAIYGRKNAKPNVNLLTDETV